MITKASPVTPLALPFKLNNEYNDIVKEFNIVFRQNSTIEKLITFTNSYPDTRINIKFENGINIAVLKTISKIHSQIYCRVTENDLLKIEELKKNDIPFFFDAYMPAINFSTLSAYLKLGVSDIYIGDDLCFNLKDVRQLCKIYKTQLRLVLNRIPATTFDKGIEPTTPIYRPQDIDLLNNFFDIYEFDCGEPYRWNEFGVLYRAWFVNKAWHGSLTELNPDLQLNFMNDTLIPDFTNYKINCGRRCMRRSSNPCKKCQQFLEVAKILQNKQIEFKDNAMHMGKNKEEVC